MDDLQNINIKDIKKYNSAFKKNKRNKSIMNAVIENGINKVAINKDSRISIQNTFSDEIKTGKITNQKSSGRCWMFAGLNILRNNIIKDLKLDNFELSQNYLLFWDKLEKANFFLENIINTYKEDTGSRLLIWLLKDPVPDGGQWEMFINLVKKYGSVPKYVMPETFHSSKTSELNNILSHKLRMEAKNIRIALSEGQNIDLLRVLKKKVLLDIYKILSYFLGEPPEKFDFEYRTKGKKFFRDTGLSPLDFISKYSKVDLGEYASIINSPTPDKPYKEIFTVKYLGNVKEGLRTLFLNMDIESLKKFAVKQIKDGNFVWFGCDVGKMSDYDSGIMDNDLYDYSTALDMNIDFEKGERLIYRDSQPTHAMVLTGVNINEDKSTSRWKVENSWGDKKGEKGFFRMSDSWFDEFLYQVIINKKYIDDNLLEKLEGEPVELMPWDPMASLALMN